MLETSHEYITTIQSIKERIRAAQYRAVLGANVEMTLLYWNIGAAINAHKTWGSRFVENLSHDIQLEFPGVTGYSVRNLKYMAKFALKYPDLQIVQALLAQLSWYHNTTLLDKVPDDEKRLWYAAQTLENGWSRNVLVHQIESDLYSRQIASEKTTNFQALLPPDQSDLVLQTLKDPYIFDFVSMTPGMQERDLEKQLVNNVTALLLELGKGFAFLGNQYHLEVGGEDFYIDLLFYNLNLRCYVVVELKTGDFQPEYAGKLNFYLSAVDGILKKEWDAPTIGLLLCKNKNRIITEYALKDVSKPIGVSTYTTTRVLPKELMGLLPSEEDFQNRI